MIFQGPPQGSGAPVLDFSAVSGGFTRDLLRRIRIFCSAVLRSSENFSSVPRLDGF